MIIKNLFIFSSCLINKIEKREKSTAATLKLLIIIFTMVWLATACKDNSNSAPDVPDNTVAMNWSSDSLNLQTNNTIHFIVYNPTYKYYSFEIKNCWGKD